MDHTTINCVYNCSIVPLAAIGLLCRWNTLFEVRNLKKLYYPLLVYINMIDQFDRSDDLYFFIECRILGDIYNFTVLMSVGRSV